MHEYWFNYNFEKLRYQLSDMGMPVDVEKGAEHETVRFGGEIGHHLVAHRLAKGEGYLTFFSGYCNWRVLGKSAKGIDESVTTSSEKRLIVCYVVNAEAFVIIDAEGSPMTRTCNAKAALDVRVSEVVDSGVLVDMASARTNALKKQATNPFSGNPPRSPYW